MLFYLVDDHQMFAEAMKSAIQGFQPQADVRVFPNASDALHALRQHTPDLILLDLEMEGMSGTDMLNVLPQHGKHIPVLVCSGNLTPSNIALIAASGARGYLRKSETTAEVKDAIDSLLAGKTYPQGFQPVNAGQANATPSSSSQVHPLSPRQQAILTLMKSGMSHGDIADTLCLSPNTIKTHVRMMYNTLDVNSRIECINKARALGL